MLEQMVSPFPWATTNLPNAIPAINAALTIAAAAVVATILSLAAASLVASARTAAAFWRITATSSNARIKPIATLFTSTVVLSLIKTTAGNVTLTRRRIIRLGILRQSRILTILWRIRRRRKSRTSQLSSIIPIVIGVCVDRDLWEVLGVAESFPWVAWFARRKKEWY